MDTDTPVNDLTSVLATDITDDNSMIEFLQDVVVKSKRLGHNKLQNQIELYIKQIQSHENDIIGLKNDIDGLTKEKHMYIELNEKQKNDILNITNNYNDLLSKFNDINTTLSNERNTNNNIKSSYDGQILKLNKLNEKLNIDLTNQKNIYNDIQQKFNDIKTRYDELTSLYSKQTFEIDIHKRELTNAKDELTTACSNNKNLYDELNTIKNETKIYLNQIDDLNTQLSLQQPLQPFVTPSIPSQKATPITRASKKTSRR